MRRKGVVGVEVEVEEGHDGGVEVGLVVVVSESSVASLDTGIPLRKPEATLLRKVQGTLGGESRGEGSNRLSGVGSLRNIISTKSEDDVWEELVDK